MVMVVHFWSFDDHYRLPRVGYLLACEMNEKNGHRERDDASMMSKSTTTGQKRDYSFLPKTN